MSRSRRVLTIVAAVVAVTLLVFGIAVWRIKRHLPRWLTGETIVLQIDAGHPYDEGMAPKAALARTIAVLRQRADKISSLAFVDVEGPRVRVVLPRLGLRVPPDAAARLLTRSGRLEFLVVDDGSAYMRGVAESLKATPIDGVEVVHDTWTEKDSGDPHNDIYVRAPTLEKLHEAWATLVERRGLPADHTILPGHKDDAWRSYYVLRKAEVTGDAIADAEPARDAQTGRPEVTISFDADGAKKFEELTAGAIGKKLAIVIENEVNSAPVVETRIGGGHARITMGGFTDPIKIASEARDLVAVLRTGGLPAPVYLIEGK